MSPAHVALTAGTNRQRRTDAPRRAEDEPVADDRRWNHFVAGPAAAPQLASGRRIVGNHTRLTVDDHFIVIGDVDGDRRAPANRGLAAGFPQLLTGPLIEGGNERAAVLILIQDDSMFV